MFRQFHRYAWLSIFLGLFSHVNADDNPHVQPFPKEFVVENIDDLTFIARLGDQVWGTAYMMRRTVEESFGNIVWTYNYNIMVVCDAYERYITEASVTDKLLAFFDLERPQIKVTSMGEKAYTMGDFEVFIDRSHHTGKIFHRENRNTLISFERKNVGGWFDGNGDHILVQVHDATLHQSIKFDQLLSLFAYELVIK